MVTTGGRCQAITVRFVCVLLFVYRCLLLFVCRGGVLDSPLCLNADARYLVDVVFNKQPDGYNSNGILIDSVSMSCLSNQ